MDFWAATGIHQIGLPCAISFRLPGRWAPSVPNGLPERESPRPPGTLRSQWQLFQLRSLSVRGPSCSGLDAAQPVATAWAQCCAHAARAFDLTRARELRLSPRISLGWFWEGSTASRTRRNGRDGGSPTFNRGLRDAAARAQGSPGSGSAGRGVPQCRSSAGAS